MDKIVQKKSGRSIPKDSNTDWLFWFLELRERANLSMNLSINKGVLDSNIYKDKNCECLKCRSICNRCERDWEPLKLEETLVYFY
jgi:hypothetical protein